MVNVWKFVGAGKVRLVDSDGKEYIGYTAGAMDEEETETQEDGIVIETEHDGFILFLTSEIKSIKKL